MTTEEAIKIIADYEVNGCGYCHQGGDEIPEAFNMAINALKAQESHVIIDEELMNRIRKAPITIVPAVDAVSVEWLQNFRNGERTTLDDVESIDWILACWQQEQEER